MFFFKLVIISASNRNNYSNRMSSRNTANRNTSAVAATPYCKVCRDAGKSEKEYTSHFVKDQPGPDGKVVCPTLLNQACRICHKTGHTSSYCSQYKSRRDYHEEPRREEPRREERYIAREEPRREDYRRDRDYREERYINREEPRREDYRRERDYREERYIARDEQPRRSGGSYYDLREDTERREREIRDRDDAYYHEQERRSKPWLQAALKKQEPEEQPRRRQPYAHPHGPRTRLNLEATALCASKHAIAAAVGKEEPASELPVIDVRKVNLNHAANWGDEDAEEPFVCDPEQSTREFFQDVIMSNLTSSAEHDFIEECDDQRKMPFECGE